MEFVLINLLSCGFPSFYMDFPGGSDSKESACNARDLVQSLGQKDPLEEEMATHFSILAWRIPWTEEPGGESICATTKTQHSQKERKK